MLVVLVALWAATGCARRTDPAWPAVSIEPRLGSWHEPEIRAFEERDRIDPPEPGRALFIGSSSIRMWSRLAGDMSPVPVLNRGFGGSSTPEVLAVFDRIVKPYEPRVIVYYCGDNDLGTESTDWQAAADGFIAFDQRARAEWPGIEVLYIAIKPSIARWSNWEAMRLANAEVERYCAATPGATFLDIATPMLATGEPPAASIFLDDGLHLNEAGYEMWTGVVRPEVIAAWRRASIR